MASDSGAATIDPGLATQAAQHTRRRRIQLAVAGGLLIAVAAGVGGPAVVEGAADPVVATLPAVVLGEAREPVPVYERGASGLNRERVATLHVRFVMIRSGPAASQHTLTLVAPDEAGSGIATLGGRQGLTILFEDKEYPLGLSYPADFDGSAVDFFTMLPDPQTAFRFAESVTSSVASGPPIGDSPA